MLGKGVPTQQEFETHMTTCPACLSQLDDDGTVIPVTLCATGVALEYAAQWDDGVQEWIETEARRMLAFLEG